MTLHELCKELNNWFDRGQPKWIGKISISDNKITFKGELSYTAGQSVGLQEGQYFRIVGSVFNDGVYQNPPATLKDESFDGAIWSMAIPADVIALLDEINAWIDLYGKADSAAMSPFQSESFGGYSYSKGAIGRSGEGSGATNPGSWQSVFADRLNLWRKA